jgi:hypothetical protein
MLNVMEMNGEMDISNEIESGDGDRPSFIIHSHCPLVITEEQQQRDFLPATTTTHLIPDDWYQQNAEDIDQIANEMAQIDHQYQYYNGMAKNNSGMRGSALRDHYSKKVQIFVRIKN